MTASVSEQPAASVYVIGAQGGPQKIGVAANSEARRLTLQVASSAPLVTAYEIRMPRPQAFAVERHAHWLLQQARQAGEWFRVSPAEAIGVIGKATVAVARGEGHGGRRKGRNLGRPPLKRGLKVRQAAVWLHEDLLASIKAEAGPQGFSEFMREAAERELDRRKRAAARKPTDP